MKVYLVRHAESESNATQMLQSHDSQLSVSGIEQTRLLLRRFEEIPVDVVITSPFPRAVQTAVGISSAKKAPLEESHLIANRKRASATIGMSYRDPQLHDIEKSIAEHAHDPSWHLGDEENMYEFLQRIRVLVKELEKRKEEHLVLVTHAIVIRGIVASMIFGQTLTVELFGVFREHTLVMNTGVTVCETIDAMWKLIGWNDTAHLLA